MAAEVSHFVVNSRLGVQIKGLPFPADLAKDLKTGFTTRIVIRVTLLLESKPVARELIAMAVTYDLWDEQFRIVTTIHGTTRGVETVADVAQVIAGLGDMRFATSFAVRDLPHGRYRLQTSTLLNPIEKERLEQLRRWVAENSTQTGGLHPGSDDPAAPLSGATSADVLNGIFELYIKGEDVAAWHFEPEVVVRVVGVAEMA